jgi:adenosylhomocysteine nucleosidase
MIAILGALEQEIKDIKKSMSITGVISCENRRTYRGKFGGQDCLLALTGIGKKGAEDAVRFIAGKFPLKAVISTGFGGALNERAGVGDVVVYSSLVCMDQSEELFCDPGLLAAATGIEGMAVRTLKGKGVTVPVVCEAPDDKKKLGEEVQADVTDMESYWIARVALENGLPFIAVRSIFDAVQDDLSFLGRLTIAGEIAPGRACGYLVSHPGCLPRLFACSRKASTARTNMAAFVERLVEVLATREASRKGVLAGSA